MMRLRQLPIRPRLTLGFMAAMGLLLAVIATVLYVIMGAVLLDEIETGLRSRAATIEADLPSGLNLATPTRGLVESHEAFAQVTAPDGTVLESSPGMPAQLIPRDALAHLTGSTYFQRRVPRVADVAKVLAVPVTKGSRRYVIVVGSSMSDRTDALRLIATFFLVGGPVALFLASTAGWLVAGAALRPVERMRQQASLISASGPDQRLSVPDPDDEIKRLAQTLNGMLERLDEATRAERRFLDNASHELRTPLTALKAELDLARARPRSATELSAALDSASEETDRLARMADDLLLLSRAQAGRLPVQLEPTALRDLLVASANLFRARAATAGVDIRVTAPDASVRLDGSRVRQAVDNLLDNAIRFSHHTIELRGAVNDGVVRITVDDDGPGFSEGFEHRAFEAFQQSDAPASEPRTAAGEGAGLGLTIVQMVADSHRGTVTAENTAEGARVTLTLPNLAH
ncbi:MAG: integral rane sensor signal transduction histidine kinase [Actinomycetia bacterium]|nr:integral rane sensor signal transduction histidine kinase [Actinomycetes bacterium]